MDDIAKCRGTDCPQRDECRRYTAPASERQSWSSWDADLARNGGRCDGYWPIVRGAPVALGWSSSGGWSMRREND